MVGSFLIVADWSILLLIIRHREMGKVPLTLLRTVVLSTITEKKETVAGIELSIFRMEA